MRKNRKKSNIIMVILLAAFFGLMAYGFYRVYSVDNETNGIKNIEKSSDMTTDEENSSEGTTNIPDDASVSFSENTTSESSQSDATSMDASALSTAMEIKNEALEYKTIGKMTFRRVHGTDYSQSGTFEKKYKAGSMFYTDGVYGDVIGAAFGIDAMDGTYPKTKTDAAAVVNEYIVEGAGALSAWEETEKYFVREFRNYTSSSKTSNISYTLVPKEEAEDNYVYLIILTAKGRGDSFRAVSESTFRALMDPLQELVPDSVFADMSYEHTYTLLKEIASDESAAFTGSMSGVQELDEAADGFDTEVYGTDPGALSDEEKRDLYQKYIDPQGYNELHSTEKKENHWANEESTAGEEDNASD